MRARVHIILVFLLSVFFTVFYFTAFQTIKANTTAPAISINESDPYITTNSTPTITGTATDVNNTVTSVEFGWGVLSDPPANWYSCTADDGAFDEASEDFTCTVAEAMQPSEYTVYVRATDSLANTTLEGEETSVYMYVDLLGPVIAWDALGPIPNSWVTTDSSPEFTGGVGEAGSGNASTVANVEFQIDGTGGTWTACTPDDGAFDEDGLVGNEESATCSLPELANGDHTFHYRTTDALGNVTVDGEGYGHTSKDFTVRADAPSVSIVPDAFSSANTNPDSATLSWSHTTGTGPDKALIVGIALRGNREVTSVTYNGQALSKIRSTNTGDARSEIWYMVNPSEGTHTVEVTAASSGTTEAGAMTYFNVAQTDTVRADAGQTSDPGWPDTVTDVSLEVVSELGDIVIDALSLQSANASLNPGPQQLERVNQLGTAGRLGMGEKPGYSNNTDMEWTFNPDYYSQSGASIKPNLDQGDTVNDNTPSLSGNAIDTSDTISTVEYQVDAYDDGSWSSCSADDGTFDSSLEAFTCTTSQLLAGEHTVYIRTLDSAGTYSLIHPTTFTVVPPSSTPTVKIVSDAISSAATPGDATSLSWSHTTGAGPDRLMVVGVGLRGGSQWQVDSITYGDQNLTKIRHDINGTDARSELWYLESPDSGTDDITVNINGNVTIIAAASTYFNVAQQDAIRYQTGRSSNPGPDASSTLSVPTLADDLVVDALGLQSSCGDCLSVGAGQNELVDLAGSFVSLGLSDKVGEMISTDMIWNITPDNWYGHSGAAFRPNLDIGVYTNDSTPAVTGYAIDDTNIISGVEYQVDGTGGSWTACSADDGTFDSLTEGYTCQVSSDLSAGQHAIYVRAQNQGATYSESYSVLAVLDQSEPTVSLTALSPDPTEDTTPSFSGTAADGESAITSVEYQIDGIGGSWTACSPDDGTFDTGDEDFTCTTNELAAGEHTIYVRATDAAGNVGTGGNIASDTFEVFVDTFGPEIQLVIDDAPYGPGFGVNINIFGIATDDSNISMILAQTDTEIMDDPDACIPYDFIFDSPTEVFYCPFSGLADGEHSIIVAGMDEHGNFGVTTDSFTADSTGPSVQIDAYSPDPTADTTPVLTGTVTDNYGVYAVYLYTWYESGGDWIDIDVNCTPDDGAFDSLNEDYTCQLPELPVGDYEMEVYAEDIAVPNGNLNEESEYLYLSIETTPISITLDDPDPNPTIDVSPTITGSATESEATVANIEYQIDGTGGSWHTCTADDGSFDAANEDFSCTLSDLSVGEHTIYVRGSDASGNITPSGQEESVSITIDQDPSTIKYPDSFGLVSPLNTFINDDRPTYNWWYENDNTDPSFILSVDNGDSGSFDTSLIETGILGSNVETNRYTIYYPPNNIQAPDNYDMGTKMKSSDDWENDENDGKLKEGERRWTVAYHLEGSRTIKNGKVYVDRTNPEIGSISLSNDLQELFVSGQVSDRMNGSNEDESDFIRSNPDEVEIKVTRVIPFFFDEEVGVKEYTFDDSNCDLNSEEEVLSCPFTVGFATDNTSGTFRVEISARDNAGNRESYEEEIELNLDGPVDDDTTGETGTEENDETSETGETDDSENTDDTQDEDSDQTEDEQAAYDDSSVEEQDDGEDDQTSIREIIKKFGLSVTQVNKSISENVANTREVLQKNSAAKAVAAATSGITAAGITTVAAVGSIGVIQTVGVGISAMRTAATVGNVVDGVGVFIRYLSHVSLMFVPVVGLLRSRVERSVGMVLDTSTGMPLSNVYLTFYSTSGNLKSAMTNKNGRYTLKLDPDKYIVRGEKNHYKMADAIDIRRYANLFAQVYIPGETILINNSQYVNLAVGMEPKEEDQNILSYLHYFASVLSTFMRKFSFPLMLVGLVIAGYSWLVLPTTLNSLTFWVLFSSIVIFIIQKILRRRTWGSIKTQSGPLTSARLEVYRKTGAGEELYTITETDKNGRYQLSPENGEYIIKILNQKGNIVKSFAAYVTDRQPYVRKAVVI